jgi:hypothetical protein
MLYKHLVTCSGCTFRATFLYIEEYIMKKLYIAAVLIFFSIATYAGEGRTPKDVDEHRMTEVRNTGVVIEDGLTLSSEQLALLIDQHQSSIPLDRTRTFVGWNDLFHARYVVVTTAQAVRIGDRIQRVAKDTREQEVVLNLFLPFALLYVVCMLVMYYISNAFFVTPTAFAAALFLNIFALVAASYDTTPATTTAVVITGGATVVVGAAFDENVADIRKNAIISGIALMLIAIAFSIFGI